MKPLHETKTEVTFKEFKKLHSIENFWSYRFIHTVLFAPLAVFVPFYFVDFRWISMLIAIGVFSVIIAAYFIIHHFRMKKLYNNVTKHFDIRLFDDKIEQESESGIVSAEYSALEKITETRKNLYLRISKNHTIVLIKDDCPDELISFLKTKLRRYDRRIDGFGASALRVTASVVSIVVAVAILGGAVGIGECFFGYQKVRPLNSRIHQILEDTFKQQMWVYAYLNWEYETVGNFLNIQLELFDQDDFSVRILPQDQWV